MTAEMSTLTTAAASLSCATMMVADESEPKTLSHQIGSNQFLMGRLTAAERGALEATWPRTDTQPCEQYNYDRILTQQNR
jgi:hypothetical protein